MRKALNQWLALSAHERLTLLGLMVLLPLLRLGLLLAGFERMQALATRPASADAKSRSIDPELALAEAERLARLVAIAGRRGPLAASCLPQALAIFWLLTRRGLAPRIRFGVCHTGQDLLAHAWVELQGVALADGDRGQTPLGPG